MLSNLRKGNYYEHNKTELMFLLNYWLVAAVSLGSWMLSNTKKCLPGQHDGSEVSRTHLASTAKKALAKP